MRVLAVDTATYLGTAAVLEDGKLLAELGASVRAAHGETLLPHVRHLLEMAKVSLADIDLFAVGIGPGSFTGVRIGVATLKGLALAEGKPLCGVVTLRALARGMVAAAPVRVPMLDAYKGEVYTAAYELDSAGGLVERVAPMHAAPEAAVERLRAELGQGPLAVAGDGVARYEEAISAALGPSMERAPALCDVPRAACVALEAQERFAATGPDDLAALEPMYLRASDAKLPSRPLRLT